MIDFASLVGKITGKLPGQTDGKAAATGETGVATGGAFADLVRLATQIEASRGPGNLRLVVDNGAMPEVTSAALQGLSLNADGALAPVATETAPVSDGESETESPAPETLAVPAQNPSTIIAPPLVSVAPAPIAATPVTTSPVAPAPIVNARLATASVATVPLATATSAPIVAVPGAPPPVATLPDAMRSMPIAVASVTVSPGATAPVATLPVAAMPVATVSPVVTTPVAAAPLATPSSPVATAPAATQPHALSSMMIATMPRPAAPSTQVAPTLTDALPTNGADTVAALAAPAEQKTPVVTQTVLPSPIAANPIGKVTAMPEEALRLAMIASSRPTRVESPAEDAAIAPASPATEASTGPEGVLTVEEMTSQAKPGMLTAALRMLAPRPRTSTSEAVDGTTANIATPAATSHDAKSVEALSALSLGASEKLQTTAASTSSPVDATQVLSAPLRSIVEALPPVIQSELGAPSVRAAAGPSTGEVLGDQVIDMGVSGQWIDRMAREIAGLADGTGHSRFTLNPPHLGRLQIDLWREEGATSIRMLTETDEAAQRLQEGRTALQGDARVAALSFASITVEKASGAFDTAPRDQGGQRQGSDLSGQMQQQQQQPEGQGQSRANNARANGSDWVGRIAGDEPNQQDDDSSRAPTRAANGRVRFA
jgi:flagellar hook-length control protein FliK